MILYEGDILLKKLKKTPKVEMKPTSKIPIGRHRLICNDMLANGNYVLLKTNGMITHPEHHTKKIPAGIYKIVKQKSYKIWDFSEPPKD